MSCKFYCFPEFGYILVYIAIALEDLSLMLIPTLLPPDLGMNWEAFLALKI
jgi:hypothetical protein